MLSLQDHMEIAKRLREMEAEIVGISFKVQDHYGKSRPQYRALRAFDRVFTHAISVLDDKFCEEYPASSPYYGREDKRGEANA